jgi:hypothetical protein
MALSNGYFQTLLHPDSTQNRMRFRLKSKKYSEQTHKLPKDM